MLGARRTVLRIGVDCVLLGALGLLIIFGIGLGSGKPSPWRIYPGPRPVRVGPAQRCLAGAPSLAVRRVGASALTVGFVNGAALRLAFLRGGDGATRIAPWTFAPAYARSSLNNVVITRPDRSTRPPRSSLRLFLRCLLAA
jgi:hypothetical protein